MRNLCLMLACVLIAQSGMANDGMSPQVTEAITVTANRDKTPVKDLPQSVTVLDRKDIEHTGATTVADVLQTVPGIIVNRNGGPGAPVSVYLRGTKPGQTVVMVDGIEINDPMSPDRAVDLSSLTTDMVQRIEVVFGPQSPVYGSDAMGGVINIVTTQGESGVRARVEGGSYDTVRTSFRLQQQSGEVHWWVGGGFFDTNGISAADEADGNTEADGYTNRTATGGVSWQRDRQRLEVSGMIINGNGDLDTAGGPSGDNPFYTFDREETFLRTAWSIVDPLGHAGESRLSWTWSRNLRRYDNPSEGYPPVVHSRYDGRMQKLNWHNRLDGLAGGILRFGLEWDREQGDSEYHSLSSYGPYDSVFAPRHVTTRGLYLSFEHRLGDWLLNAGGRLDDHDIFGQRGTVALGAVRMAKDGRWRFRIHGGTSFKAPTLYQLYSPYGSVDLSPETGTSGEVGLDHALMEGRLWLGLTWFTHSFDHMIDFDPNTFSYMNIASATVNGSEIRFSWQGDRVAWTISYDFLHAEDDTTGERLLRRPRSALSGSMDLDFDRVTVHVHALYNNSREDLDYASWPAARVSLDAFFVLDMRIRWQFQKDLALTVTGRNILDESYQLVNGYGTPGDNWYVGLVYRHHGK